MAFTLDQNVSGAAAAPQPVQNMSGTSIAASALGGLLDAGSRQAKLRAGSGGTQTDRDRTVFKTTLQNAQQDLAKGLSPDAVSQKYAADFASLGLNPEEKAVVTNLFGEDIFLVPKQVETPADTATSLFNNADELTRLGYIDIEMKKAEAEGETISRDVAAERARNNYAAFQVAANAGILQGNLDFNSGFDQNMKTLDSFTSAVSAALQVEQRGENFSLDSVRQLLDGFLLLKSQPSFQKPSGKLALEKWDVMETRLQNIESLFTRLQDYDAKGATAKAKQLMGVISLSGESPLSALAAKDPDFMTKMAAQIAPDITADLAEMGDIPVVDHSALDFDPIVLEFMGVAPSGQQTGETPEGGFDIPPSPFPVEMGEKYDGMKIVEKAKFRAYHRSAITGLEAGSLDSPEAINAYASSVTALSYDLTQNDKPSSQNFDVLFSNRNIARVNALQAQGGEAGRVAGNLRAQMGAALQHNQARYGVLAAGLVSRIPQVKIDETNGKFTLDAKDDPVLQEIAAVVSVYYGGDFEALWAEGGTAKISLKNRLAREGKITPDSPEFERFDAATKVLESSLWKGMASRYNTVRGIPQRLKSFKDTAAKLKLALPSFTEDPEAAKIAQETADTLGNTITTTELPPALGGQENPFTFKGATDEEGVDFYNSLPSGSYFIDPSDGKTYRKP